MDKIYHKQEHFGMFKPRKHFAFDFSFHLDTNGKINNQGNIYLPKGAICAKTIVLPPISWIANNRKLFPILLSSIRNISQ